MIRLTELLRELVQNMLPELTDEEKQRMGVPVGATGKAGKWYDQQGNYIGKTVDGKYQPTTQQGQGTPQGQSTQEPPMWVQAMADLKSQGTSQDQATQQGQSTQSTAPWPRKFEPDQKLTMTGRQEKLLQSLGFGYHGWSASHDLLKPKGLVPLEIDPPGKPWTRFDGSKYTPWGTMKPKVYKSRDHKDPEKVVQDTVDTFVNGIVAKGAKHIGTVSGEFGSSEFHDAYQLGGDVYINRGTHIDYGTKSRLRNSGVWRKNPT